MAFLDTVRHHGRRTAIQLTVALIAAVAVASPASADGADPCPRPEGSGAFVYRNGDLRPLQPVRDAEVTYHFGINNLRQTVGFYIDGGAVLGPDCTYPLNANHGFVQDRWGRVTTIDVPQGDAELPEGGINDRGDIAGTYTDAGAVPDPDGVFPPRGSIHGFIRDRRGRFTTFDVAAPRMHAVTDINDHGQVVGYVDETFTTGSGFLYDSNGSVTRIEVPGATRTEPRGINNRGQIVGSYEMGDRNPDGSIPPSRMHGFIWDDGQLTTFDVPDATLTVPTHINNQGHITGGYRDTTGRAHGFLRRHGRYTTIDAPGRAESIASGINDRGDIVLPEPGVGLPPVATP